LPKKCDVYLLQKLHSKIYLSSGFAIVGSANSSENGLGEGGTHEVAIIIRDRKSLNMLEEIVESYRNASIPATKHILYELKQEYDAESKKGNLHVTPNRRGRLKRAFTNVWHGENRYARFFPVWVWNRDESATHSRAEANAKRSFRLEANIDGISCAAEDSRQLKTGDWILYWYRHTNPPWNPLSKRPYWYKIVKGPVDLRKLDPSLKNYPYPCTVFGRPPNKSEITPFEIDDTFVQAFHDVIMRPKNVEWRARIEKGGNERHPWKVRPLDKTRALIGEVYQLIARS
jgi:hypothetical protein